MTNFEAFRWTFSSSTNSEIGRSVIINTTTHDQDDILHQNSSIKIRICETFCVEPKFFGPSNLDPNQPKMPEFGRLLGWIFAKNRILTTQNIGILIQNRTSNLANIEKIHVGGLCPWLGHIMILFRVKKTIQNSKLVSGFFCQCHQKQTRHHLAFASYITPDGRSMMCFFCSAPLNFGKIN